MKLRLLAAATLPLALACNHTRDSARCDLPTSFEWTSSEPLLLPPEGSASIKDPSVVFFDGKWHVYATRFDTNLDQYNMVYLNFADWASAGDAPKTLADTNRNLAGYKCAPQIFYFTGDETWYLVYQTQPPAYSTSKDPSDISSWSASKRFMAMPSIIENSSTGGIDYWVICDDTDCYMFFSADNGVLYRAKTSRAQFPDGFGDTVIVMEESRNNLFEACNVYRIKGSNQYLLLVEAIGSQGRWFRSWTADRLDGEWTALADTPSNPFASQANVEGASWSTDGISHGEMLRDGYDERMVIDTCNMKYLFQGRTQAGSSYDLNEYSLGLLEARH